MQTIIQVVTSFILLWLFMGLMSVIFKLPALIAAIDRV